MAQNVKEFAYATPLDLDRRLEAWVINVGHILSDADCCPNRISSDHYLLYCVNGTGRASIGNKSFALNQGDILYIPPEKPFRSACDPKQGWEIWFTCFGGSYAQKLTTLAGLTAKQPLRRIGVQQPLIDRFHEIYSLICGKLPGYCKDAAARLILLLIDLGKPESERVADLMHHFGKISYQTQSLDEICEATGLSKYHLIRRFKHSLGVPPWTYILQLKMDEAKRLLVHTSLSIAQVAQHVGFPDANYFSRSFRKHTGVSPSAYRRL